MLNRATYHLGKTTAERNAAFNGCKDVFIFRDGDCARRHSPMRWFVHYGNAEAASGWQAGEDSFPTMGEALAYARAQFPSYVVWRRFLGRIDGRDDMRALAQPRSLLGALSDAPGYELAQDSQDIAASLEYADLRLMRLAGFRAQDVSGLMVAAGCGELLAIWATVYSRPFDNDASYWRVL